MYFVLAAGMCALGCAGAWLLRDRPLPGETGPLGFSRPVRRRWYLVFAGFFALGAVGNLVLAVVDLTS